MRKIKKYAFTTPKCWNCNKQAYSYNKNNLPTCKSCIKENEKPKCVICNNELEVKKGKYGSFFHCFLCKINFSLNRIRNIKKFK